MPLNGRHLELDNLLVASWLLLCDALRLPILDDYRRLFQLLTGLNLSLLLLIQRFKLLMMFEQLLQHLRALHFDHLRYNFRRVIYVKGSWHRFAWLKTTPVKVSQILAVGTLLQI